MEVYILYSSLVDSEIRAILNPFPTILTNYKHDFPWCFNLYNYRI